MFFTLKELVRWFGLTVFEIWINLVAFLCFTIVFALKFNTDTTIDWWTIFLPLFIGDALNTYFSTIVFVRMLYEMTLKVSLMRAVWSAIFVSMLFSFKFLLCKKLMGQINLDYPEVFAPLYILLQLIAVRACQQN